MILVQKDIDEFKAAYDGYDPWRGDDEPRFYRWMANNPQVLMAAGFQEFVAAHKLPLYKSIAKGGGLIKGKRPAFRLFDGRWIVISGLGDSREDPWDGFSLEAYRDLLATHAPTSRKFDRAFEERVVVELPSASEIVRKAAKLIEVPFVDVTNFISPKLWTPFSQDAQKEYLSSAASTLINAIKSEELTLDRVSWKQLENIVAEILRSRGMEIHVVRENPRVAEISSPAESSYPVWR